MQTVLPANGYLLVRDKEKATVRKSGLEIPVTGNAQDRCDFATVVAVGEHKDTPPAQVGDTVAFKAFAIRQRIELEGVEHWFLNSVDVLGVIKSE